MTRILALVGTRPEAIKMAPLISALKSRPWADVTVMSTGQHRGLLDQVLTKFDLVPSVSLDVMRANQSLSALTCRLIRGIDRYLSAEPHQAVLAQGDTTTVLAAALVSFYHRVPFGHVEAGMRTGNMLRPFPEEANRVLVSRLSRWHFAATAGCRQNLLREGIASERIYLTGNTVIDALHFAMTRVAPVCERRPGASRIILVTLHRRESFGQEMRGSLRAIRAIADARVDVQFLFPVHPNPQVHSLVHEELGGHVRIELTEPLDYFEFVRAMQDSFLILTDSGGVQEEAPALGKPVLVLRAETERLEAVASGAVKLIGADPEAIVREVVALLDDNAAYAGMVVRQSPYGDGRAALRIVEALESHFRGSPGLSPES